MNSATARTAIVVDRYPLYLEALERLLDKLGISVLVATTSPSEARSAITQHRPDLVVIGVEACDDKLDGLTFIREVASDDPGIRMVAVSDAADRQAALAALSIGSSAYVVRTAHPGDLATAIRQAFEQSFYLASPQMTQPAVVSPLASHSHRLTKREVEILRLASEGHSNAQMARMLWVTEQTVKFHLSNVYRKIDVGNRTEASRWAQVNGLLSDGSDVVPTTDIHLAGHRPEPALRDRIAGQTRIAEAQ
jgi:DNA-binding NarL/FixJ family response regulator